MSIRAEYRGHTKEVTALALHPEYESQFVTGGQDGQILFWDLNSSKMVEEVPNAHDGTVWDLAFHPLGHLLVSGGHDHIIQFWARARPGDDKPETLLPARYLDVAALAESEVSKPPTPLGDTLQQGFFDPQRERPQPSPDRPGRSPSPDVTGTKRPRDDDEPEGKRPKPEDGSLLDTSGFDDQFA